MPLWQFKWPCSIIDCTLVVLKYFFLMLILGLYSEFWFIIWLLVSLKITNYIIISSVLPSIIISNKLIYGMNSIDDIYIVFFNTNESQHATKGEKWSLTIPNKAFCINFVNIITTYSDAFFFVINCTVFCYL